MEDGTIHKQELSEKKNACLKLLLWPLFLHGPVTVISGHHRNMECLLPAIVFTVMLLFPFYRSGTEIHREIKWLAKVTQEDWVQFLAPWAPVQCLISKGILPAALMQQFLKVKLYPATTHMKQFPEKGASGSLKCFQVSQTLALVAYLSSWFNTPVSEALTEQISTVSCHQLHCVNLGHCS